MAGKPWKSVVKYIINKKVYIPCCNTTNYLLPKDHKLNHVSYAFDLFSNNMFCCIFKDLYDTLGEEGALNFVKGVTGVSGLDILKIVNTKTNVLTPKLLSINGKIVINYKGEPLNRDYIQTKFRNKENCQFIKSNHARQRGRFGDIQVGYLEYLPLRRIHSRYLARSLKKTDGRFNCNIDMSRQLATYCQNLFDLYDCGIIHGDLLNNTLASLDNFLWIIDYESVLFFPNNNTKIFSMLDLIYSSKAGLFDVAFTFTYFLDVFTVPCFYCSQYNYFLMKEKISNNLKNDKWLELEKEVNNTEIYDLGLHKIRGFILLLISACCKTIEQKLKCAESLKMYELLDQIYLDTILYLLTSGYRLNSIKTLYLKFKNDADYSDNFFYNDSKAKIDEEINKQLLETYTGAECEYEICKLIDVSCFAYTDEYKECGNNKSSFYFDVDQKSKRKKCDIDVEKLYPKYNQEYIEKCVEKMKENEKNICEIKKYLKSKCMEFKKLYEVFYNRHKSQFSRNPRIFYYQEFERQSVLIGDLSIDVALERPLSNIFVLDDKVFNVFFVEIDRIAKTITNCEEFVNKYIQNAQIVPVPSCIKPCSQLERMPSCENDIKQIDRMNFENDTSQFFCDKKHFSHEIRYIIDKKVYVLCSNSFNETYTPNAWINRREYCRKFYDRYNDTEILPIVNTESIKGSLVYLDTTKNTGLLIPKTLVSDNGKIVINTSKSEPMNKLNHSLTNIIETQEAVVFGDIPFFYVEYIPLFEFDTLDHKVDMSRQIATLCQNLFELYSKGIIHGNLCLSNIKLSLDNFFWISNFDSNIRVDGGVETILHCFLESWVDFFKEQYLLQSQSLQADMQNLFEQIKKLSVVMQSTLKIYGYCDPWQYLQQEKYCNMNINQKQKEQEKQKHELRQHDCKNGFVFFISSLMIEYMHFLIKYSNIEAFNFSDQKNVEFHDDADQMKKLLDNIYMDMILYILVGAYKMNHVKMEYLSFKFKNNWRNSSQQRFYEESKIKVNAVIEKDLFENYFFPNENIEIKKLVACEHSIHDKDNSSTIATDVMRKNLPYNIQETEEIYFKINDDEQRREDIDLAKHYPKYNHYYINNCVKTLDYHIDILNTLSVLEKNCTMFIDLLHKYNDVKCPCNPCNNKVLEQWTMLEQTYLLGEFKTQDQNSFCNKTLFKNDNDPRRFREYRKTYFFQKQSKIIDDVYEREDFLATIYPQASLCESTIKRKLPKTNT